MVFQKSKGWTSEQRVISSSASGISLTKGVGVVWNGKLLSHGHFSLKFGGQKITVLEEWNQKNQDTMFERAP